VYAYNNIVKI